MDDTYTINTTLGTLGTNSLTIPAGDTKSTTLTVSGTEIKTYTAIVTAASSHASETKSLPRFRGTPKRRALLYRGE